MLLVASSPRAWAACDGPLALQILGAGGPFGTVRASAGYILWIDGVSRIMVDAGGGTFSRFHEAGARMSDLRLLVVSHFHPDHSSEIAALLWPQTSALRIAGPSGSDGYPSVVEFLDGLFEAPDAVFRVIGQRVDFATTTVDVSGAQPVEVFSDGQVTVRGIGVPHGDIPTVGYRVDVGGSSVGFSSDQIGTNPAYTALVRGVDLLVVHLLRQRIQWGQRRPSMRGQPCGERWHPTRVESVVLSHLSESEPEHTRHTSHSGSHLEASVAHLRSRYDGPLMIGEDLLCIPIE